MINSLKQSNVSVGIIGSGEMAVIIADQAQEIGVITHSFSNNSNDKVIGHSTQHHVIDIYDIDNLVDTCRNLGVKGILPTTELTISIAATVADQLGLIGMPINLSSKVTDKGYIRDKAKICTIIKQPKYEIWDISNVAPIVQNFPVIIKPTSLGGKRGIIVVESKEYLTDALEYSKSYAKNSNRKVIIEEYLQRGKEYSVESLSYKGMHKVIQVTEKITSGPPHCVELGHMQPAFLNRELRSKVENAVIDLLTVIGIDNSTSHTEIKIIDGDIYLIELNSRSGGDHIAHPLTYLSTGYPYIKNAIMIALNNFIMPNTDLFENNFAGIIFITKQTSKFKTLFDNCDNYSWLYRKNKITEELSTITYNQAFDTNYIIYSTKTGVPQEIKELLDD